LHQFQRKFAGRSGCTRFEHSKDYQGAESWGEGSAKWNDPIEEVAMSLHNGKNTFGNQFQALMEKIDISSTQLGPVVGVKHPAPWLNDAIRINTTLTRMKKSETYRQEALSLLQQYYLIIYTYGAKMGEKVGYSVVLGENATKRRIDEDCSIFTSEARAIFDVCVLAVDTTPDLVVIATDSLSTLQGVAKFRGQDKNCD
jgi:hypothetical protein